MNRKLYIILPLFWFAIAIILGTILRSAFIIRWGDWFNFPYFLHTHSHIAFLGWIFNAIYYFLLKQNSLLEKKKYGVLFILLNLSVLGMLCSFPFEGYALWSIIFSTLHIVFSTIFGVFFYRDTKADKSIHLKFAIAGIFFMIISSVGPFAMGPIVANGLQHTDWYNLAIYFYLHFQYNGWFLFALFSILIFNIKSLDKANWDRAFNLFFISTILNYSLSTLWTNPGWVINIISVLSSLMQLHALFLMSKDLLVHFRILDKFNSNLFKIIFASIVLKVFSALIGSIQEIADFVYHNRNLTIGFLHLIFLGILTPFFFYKIAETLKLERFNKYRVMLSTFYIFFVLTELLLGSTALPLRGNTAMIVTDLLVYTTWLLAASTLCLIAYFIYVNSKVDGLTYR